MKKHPGSKILPPRSSKNYVNNVLLPNKLKHTQYKYVTTKIKIKFYLLLDNQHGWGNFPHFLHTHTHTQVVISPPISPQTFLAQDDSAGSNLLWMSQSVNLTYLFYFFLILHLPHSEPYHKKGDFVKVASRSWDGIASRALHTHKKHK